MRVDNGENIVIGINKVLHVTDVLLGAQWRIEMNINLNFLQQSS